MGYRNRSARMAFIVLLLGIAGSGAAPEDVKPQKLKKISKG